MGKLEALVKKAKKGDGEAFVSLVQRYEDGRRNRKRI